MPESVHIADYDADWPQRFAEERAILRRVFQGADAVIEHVGSTAVPGLGAKPIIDVMMGLSALSEAESRISALEAEGYEYVQEYEAQLPERRYFRKPREDPRTVHLHCVVHGGGFWIRHLAFRDHLRRHPRVAAAYFELKRELATRYRDQRMAYTEAKSSFIEGVLREVLNAG